MLGVMCVGDGPRAHLQKLAECIRWSYGAGIVLRLGNIARLELNYCVPMGVQSGDRWTQKTLTLLDITGLMLIHVVFLCVFFNKPSQKKTITSERTLQCKIHVGCHV